MRPSCTYAGALLPVVRSFSSLFRVCSLLASAAQMIGKRDTCACCNEKVQITQQVKRSPWEKVTRTHKQASGSR